MMHVRDGLSFSNENSTLGDALFRYLAERMRRKRRESEGEKTQDTKPSTSAISTTPAAASDRAIRVSGIDHVNMSVADLSRAMAFYESVFDFRLVEDGRARTDAPYVIMTAGGRAYLALHENEKTGKPSRPFVNHWGFVVGDLDRVLDKLEKQEVPVQDGDSRSGGIRQWAHSRSIYVYDPDGHEIELAEVFGGGLAGSRKVKEQTQKFDVEARSAASDSDPAHPPEAFTRFDPLPMEGGGSRLKALLHTPHPSQQDRQASDLTGREATDLTSQ